MRITGGELCGRRLKVPPAGVRPTADRVREALFSVLGDAVAGARVLDLFAGTGAWGIEAWSRGASAATWVERDRRVYRVLAENVAALCGDEGGEALRCVRADAIRYLHRRGGEGEPYHVVFADPPYDRDGTRTDGPGKVLRALAEGSMLALRGRLVMEQWAEAPVEEPPGWEIGWERTYGETRILIYRTRPPVATEQPG